MWWPFRRKPAPQQPPIQWRHGHEWHLLRKEPMKTHVVKNQTDEHCITLDAEDVIRLLIAKGHHVPPDAVVTAAVPGGGDWSNLDLDLRSDSAITVRWTEKRRVVE